MIGQQLDLFGGPLRPPKKILVDEQPEEQKESSAESKPTQETAIAADDPVNIHVEIPASPVVAEEKTTSEEENEMLTGEVDTADELLPDDDEIETAPDKATVTEELPTEAGAEDLPDEDLIPGDAGDAIIQPVTPELEAIPEPLGVEALDEADEPDTAPIPEIQAEEKPASSQQKSESIEIQQVAFRGRRSGDPEEEMEMLNVPPDEELFKRQYYSMRETSAMFNVNQALLRFWENEFDILQPKKNKKGDRYFRPIDVKNLVLIYHLIRVRKFTLEGAKDYLASHKKAGDSFQLVQRLEKLKSFLLELKANL